MAAKNIRQRLAAVAFATGIALVGCEVMARIVFPAPPDPTRHPQIVFRYDPEIRYVPVANQRGWVDDGFVTTNSMGFRGREIALPKPAGRFRIVAVGDSVTFGFGVNDAETFCSIVEQQLQARVQGFDLDVVNLAVPGYDTRQEVGLLKRYAAEMKPDLVLVGFYTNDVPDALVEPGSTATGGTTIATPQPKAGQVLHMNPAPKSWIERQARKSRAIYTAVHGFKGLVRRGEGKVGSSLELDMLENHGSADLKKAWDNVGQQFRELSALAASGGFRVGVVMLPPREQVLGRFLDSEYQKRIRGFADEHGFFVIDPLPYLARTDGRKDRLFVPYDRNHPSAAGHAAIAHAIVDGLADGNRIGAATKRLARGTE